MSGFQTFSESDLYLTLRSWRESGVSSLNITCGPLLVFASYDFVEETWRVHGVRRGRIMAGSVSFYSPRYSLFRCLYGIMRTQGLENNEWEMADRHSFMYHVEYLNLISNYIPYMRVKIQRGTDEAIFIQNLLSHAYMKIKPVRLNLRRNNESDGSMELPTTTTLGIHLGFVSEENSN